MASRSTKCERKSDYDQEAYDMCVADNLMTWYEREQHFDHASYLALEQRCTYAVVLIVFATNPVHRSCHRLKPSTIEIRPMT